MIIPPRPPFPEDLLFYWQAWRELSTDRAMGMAPGPIPFTAIDAYATRYGIEDIDFFERFRRMLRELEEEYFEYDAKKPRKGEFGETLYDINDWRAVKGVIKRASQAWESSQRNRLTVVEE